MANGLPIDVAQVIALFLESAFFGIYLVTFGMVMHALFIKRTDRGSLGLFYILLALALALFIVASFDEALLLRHILQAFIWYKGPGGAIAEFNDLSNWIAVAKSITYTVQTSIADGMLIYRCFIVYNRKFWIAVSLSLLWAIGLGSGIYSSVFEDMAHRNSLLHPNEPAPSLFTIFFVPWITSLLALSLALNIIATGLILFKIWQVQKQHVEVFLSHGYGSENVGPLKRAARTIIESGSMYTLSVVILMILYLANSNAVYGVSGAIVQIIGISFNLIIVRISQGRSLETTAFRSQISDDSTAMSFVDSSRHRDARMSRRDRRNQISDFLDAQKTEVSEFSMKEPDNSGTFAGHLQQDMTTDASPEVGRSTRKGLPRANSVLLTDRCIPKHVLLVTPATRRTAVDERVVPMCSLGEHMEFAASVVIGRRA